MVNNHSFQKYFLLLVRLIAVTTDGSTNLVLAYASDRVIVRVRYPIPVQIFKNWIELNL